MSRLQSRLLMSWQQVIFNTFQGMTRTFNRNAANVRYYCDDDRTDEHSLFPLSRWTLVSDPENVPQGYEPQRKRPRLGSAPRQQYQQWIDGENRIVPDQPIPNRLSDTGPTSSTTSSVDSNNPFRIRQFAFGWKNVQALSDDESLLNADNYVYYALIAALADRKFRVAPSGPDRKRGKLIYDPNLP
ncbi:MAG: hypothetical protein Q9227_006214 [Pyrenula ochraceoflavens]